jgi:hypothetical protein
MKTLAPRLFPPSARTMAVGLLAVGALASAVPAQADRGFHGYRAGPGHHHRHHHHHGHPGRGHAGVWGPLIVGGLIGAALVGANTAQAQPQPPVVVAPPPPSHFVPAPVAPPMVLVPTQPVAPRVQYFCAPSRAYYPAVASCPEPWYVMPN